MATPTTPSTPASHGRLSDKTLAGICASVFAATVVGSLCTWLNLSPVVTSTLTGGAVGIPAAIEYRLQSRRRDPVLDAARIENGEFDSPIGLVVLLFIGVVFVVDSVAGAVKGSAFGLVRAFHVTLDDDVTGVISLALLLVMAVVYALLASFASHYLGARAYAWVTLSVVIALALRLAIVVPAHTTAELRENWTISNLVLAHAIYLVGCLAGVAVGRRRHTRFLQRKLLRVRNRRVSMPPPNPLDRRLS